MNSNNDFKSIIYFDFTGTLFDPFENLKNILNVISKNRGFKYYNNLDLNKIAKMNPIALLNTFEVPDIEKKSVVKDVLLLLEEEILNIPPVCDVKEVIYELKNSGFFLGILSSNSESNIKKWLLANDLDIFDDIISMEFQGDKTPYLQAIKSKFDSDNKFIFVSDEAKDIIQANEAGYIAVGVEWGFDAVASLQNAGATIILYAPKELLLFIGNFFGTAK